MLIKRRMVTSVVTVDLEEQVGQARHLLETHRIRHLPVVQADRLVGIVTDRDLRVAEAMAPEGAGRPVGEFMTASVITVGPDTTVEQAAMLMADNKIGGLPVLDAEDRLVGIITESDIVDVLLEALGVGTGAARLEVLVPNRPGALAVVARILGESGANIVSILSTSADEGRQLLIFRIATDDLEGVLNRLAQDGVDVQAAEEGVRIDRGL